MHRAVDELCELLSADAGMTVTPVVVKTPRALAAAMAGGHAEFGWLSPTLLVSSPELATMVPLLSSVRQGEVVFHSIVFTPAASPIETLDDAVGKRMAWVARSSASGYIVPRLSLIKRGFDSDSAFGSQEFLGSHGAVALAVATGGADVGATYAHFENGDSDGTLIASGFHAAVPDGVARLLAIAGPIPADMVVAAPTVSLEQRTAMAAALCRLPTEPWGAQCLRKVIGAEDFRPVSPAALEELAGLVAASAALRG